MATINLGRVGFVQKGTYSGVTAYKINDVVVYNNGVYACISPTTGNLPTNTTYWKLWLDPSMLVAKTGDETITGVKTFSSSPIVPNATITGQSIPMGGIIEKTGVGIGYGIGSGGTVTQLTSKSTAVTLNKPSGRIIMNNASLASGATTIFQVGNSLVTTNDTVYVNAIDNDHYDVTTGWTSSGAFVIRVKNTTAGALAEALQIQFNVTKGATS